MKLWPNQEFCASELDRLIAGGAKRICVVAPTGAGKTVMQKQRIAKVAEQGNGACLYTNRKMLLEQTARVLDKSEIRYGIQAAGYEPDFGFPIQLCSLQTVESRTKRMTWNPHKTGEVLVDEAHSIKEATAQRILNRHLADGSVVIGFTATPLDIGHMYDELIIAGTNSELRAIGALVPCYTYAPDEPDLDKIGPVKVGEDLTNDQNVKAIMRPGIFGRVFDHWKLYNPEQRPSLLFAPGVKESIFFMEEFRKMGVAAAHIDASEIVINGCRMKSTHENRDLLARASETGEVKIVCNRFVMREGIDWPWLYHCVMASVFGSLTSFLQAGGRLLRAHPSLDRVILQDHGGNFHRHGSLNADRTWRLNLTNAMACGSRIDGFRDNPKEPQPIVCPKCKAVRAKGPKCICGFESRRSSRIVVQHDGSLKEVEGDVYKPRRIAVKPNTLDLWTRMFWRAKKSRNKMTFRQAYGFFCYENHYFPPKNLPLMPLREADWYLPVCQVPMDALRQGENRANRDRQPSLL